MTITGYQFDKAKVSASKDAAIYNALAGGRSFILDNQGHGLTVTTLGLNVTVATGMALVVGRLVEVTEPETITIPINSSGYLAICIDLSESNTSKGSALTNDYVFTNNQVSIKFVSNLTQQSIADGGLVYMFSLGKITSDASTARFTVDTSTNQVLPVDTGWVFCGINGASCYYRRINNSVTLRVYRASAPGGNTGLFKLPDSIKPTKGAPYSYSWPILSFENVPETRMIQLNKEETTGTLNNSTKGKIYSGIYSWIVED